MPNVLVSPLFRPVDRAVLGRELELDVERAGAVADVDAAGLGLGAVDADVGVGAEVLAADAAVTANVPLIARTLTNWSEPYFVLLKSACRRGPRR
jgi:hypothetical protein